MRIQSLWPRKRPASLSRFYRGSILWTTFVTLFCLAFSFILLKVQNDKREASNLYRLLVEERKREIQSHVLRSLNFIEFIRNFHNEFDSEDIKREVINRLSSITFGENGYIFILHKNGTMLLTGAKKGYLGMNLLETGDPEAIKMVTEGLKAAENPEGGFIEYYWEKPSPPLEDKRKLSFVISYPEWNWIVGAGSYFDDLDLLFQRELKTQRRQFLLSLIIIMIFLMLLFHVTVIFIYFYSRKIEKDTLLFEDYLKNGGSLTEKIDFKNLRFKEFQDIAVELNKAVEERNKLEQELKENEIKYREIVNNANSAIIKYDLEGRLTFFNECAERLFGFSADEVLGKFGVETINKYDDQELLYDVIHNTEKYTNNENDNYHKDGRWMWISWTNKSIYNDAGEKIGVLCIANDITQNKLDRKLIERNLKEKEVLLREIHHRVKNNLQIIISLLSLNYEKIQDPKDLEIFKEMEARVRSMAYLHEQLYGSQNIAEIDMADYVHRLTLSLLDSHEYNNGNLHLDLQIKNISFDLAIALPCGLIINELVTNTLKHAFPGEIKKGKELLGISISKSSDTVLLKVEDSGIGLPKDFTLDKTPSLGLRLVYGLTEQLGGKIRFLSQPGTTWEIRFPLPKTKP